jgi:hypothetical protein
MFLPPDTLKTWAGTPFRKGQLQQLEDWGYKQGKHFWVRRNGSLAVKAELLESKKAVNKPAEPDYSSLGPTKENQSPSPAARIHTARAVSASVRGRPCAEL